MEIVQSGPKRGLRWNLHAGQRRAMQSQKRQILALAGWQSGKTVIGPPWLHREIAHCGPGDYLVASPTYPLMMKKVLPEFLRLFRQLLRLGEFVGGSKNIFTFSEDGCQRTWGSVPDIPVQVFFGHAADPDSLESATVKAAWLDEAGQKGFRVASYETIMGRLSIHQGRVLITSRPYDLGWMKQLLYDPWRQAGENHPDIDVINFRSIDNPAFPREEYERARRTLPPWKFRMAYDGLFTRPAGLIYDNFDDATHKIKRFPIPPNWPRYLGLDFGGVNTAGIFFAAEQDGTRPTGRYIAYREYKAGGRTAVEHCYHLRQGEPRFQIAAGGSKSEGQWRTEFARGGIHAGQRVEGISLLSPAVPDVEVGIQRVYALHAEGKILVFDDLHGYLEQKATYSRELDDAGEPTEGIADKETFHFLDAERYIVGHLHRGGGVPTKPISTQPITPGPFRAGPAPRQPTRFDLPGGRVPWMR